MRRVSTHLMIGLLALVAACDDDDDKEPSGTTGGSSTDTATDGTSSGTTGGTDSTTTGSESTTGDEGSTSEGSTGSDVQGLPVLGGYTHSLDNVELEVIVDQDLAVPADLEFNPDAPNELWITNRGDNSVTIVFDPGGDTQQVVNKTNRFAGGDHFLAKPAALAFGAAGFMATAQQEDEVTQPSTPADFMGPTLWPSDSGIFEAGHASHMDMLHNSPNGSGIAWERDNAYWIFDGAHGSLTRYDFHDDHGHGGADHSDGEIFRAADGQLSYVPGVAAHIAFDSASSLLYSVDPGANRIVVLNTTTGTMGSNISPNYDGVVQRFVDGMELTTLVDGSSVEVAMGTPSGLELHDDLLFVTDHETSTIAAFDLQGELIDWLDTGWPAGTLMGLEFDAEGRLYLVDAGSGRVFRISAKE